MTDPNPLSTTDPQTPRRAASADLGSGIRSKHETALEALRREIREDALQSSEELLESFNTWQEGE